MAAVRNNKPFVSLIVSNVPNRNHELLRCLDSIEDGQNFNDYEVIVVGETSVEEMEFLANYRNLSYILSEKMGLSYKRNFGIAKAKGKLVAFLDDDCFLDKKFLRKVAKFWKSNDNINGFVYEVVNIKDKKNWFILPAYGTSINFGNFRFIPSISFIVELKRVKEIGGFDEKLGAGTKFGSAEESDLILRLLRENCTLIFSDGMKIFHPCMNSSIKPVKGFSYGMGLGALYKKHRDISRRFDRSFLTILIRPLGGFFLCVVTLKAKKAVSYLMSFTGRVVGYYLFR